MVLFHIDDDFDDCEIFYDALQQVSQASYLSIHDPIIALRKLMDLDVVPDIIVLDINMPGMNGLDLLGQLKREVNTCNIPVIIFSTSSQEKHKTLAYERGAKDYITKPADFETLKRVVREILAT